MLLSWHTLIPFLSFFFGRSSRFAPTIGGFRIHHWMYGLALTAVSAVFKNIPLFAVGLALFIDELTFLLMRGKNHTDNYSKISLLGTVFFIFLIYLLREFIIGFF